MRKISIENLLTWAFVEELPKVGAGMGGGPGVAMSAWEAFGDMIVLGTIVDRSPNGFGVIPSFVYEGDAHMDALVVGDAVRALHARQGFEVPAGWNPFPEWPDEHGLIRAEVARIVEFEYARGGKLNGDHIVNLVTTAAILKTGPDWSAKPPKTAMVMNKGKPAWFVKRWHRDRKGQRMLYEDNGFDQKRQKPMQGAYRKYRLDGSIHGAIKARLDWQLWQSALETLADSLRGQLSNHEIAPFAPNRQPWLGQRNSAPVSQAIENAAE